MTRPTILVTGSTGKTGSAVVAQLREKDWPVRAVVHKRDGRSDRLAALGADVVVADLYDPEQMSAAMAGTARAYFCPPVQPFMVQAAAAFAVAATEAKLESVVHLSMWLAAPAHPSLHTRQQWLVEKMFRLIPGAAHTVVNPGVFAEPILNLLPVAANLGVLPNPFGDLRNAPPSNEDIARVIVGALADPARHDGKRYRPTGPAVLSMAEIAETMGRVVGQAVKLQDVPVKTFLKAAKVGGAGPFELCSLTHFIADGHLGVFAVHAPTTDVFDCSGGQPEPFEATARRYAARPEARRTLANKLRAVHDFARVLRTPAFDVAEHDRRQQQPVPPRPQLAGASAVWRREHAPAA